MADRLVVGDYVVIGAGAAAMAFTDTMLSESNASIVLIDRRPRPGGHWNDAYPFIRLHTPAIFYGVNSAPLGSGRIETLGLNRGLLELATKPEICSYFDQVMNHRFLTSGRVTFLPLHDYGENGVATSRQTGDRVQLVARRKIVDATSARTQIPFTHSPAFPIAQGMTVVTPNELPSIDRPGRDYVVIGAGKTSIDTVLWLLEQGIAPESIAWLRPRDCWLYNRVHFQPRLDLAEGTIGGWVDEVEAAQGATSIDDLFRRLEARKALFRIDPDVIPTMYRCATIVEPELEEVRRVRNVVRLGRVMAIEQTRIRLEQGETSTSPDHVHVNCTADGVPVRSTQPIFQSGRIVLQYVLHCWPLLSAALIAFLEVHRQDDADRNGLAIPIPMANEPLDWLRQRILDERNMLDWMRHPDIEAWRKQSRLDGFSGLLADLEQNPAPTVAALLSRLDEGRPAALARLAALLQPV